MRCRARSCAGIIAAGFLLLVGTLDAAYAQSAGIESVERAFTDWLTQHKVDRAVLAVARNRKLVFARGYGGNEPGAPILLASVSKAITGVCVGTLVDAGKLTFETPVGTALGQFFQRNGEPADARIKEATIAAVLSHRTGFNRSEGDPATGKNLADHLRNVSARAPGMEPLLARTLRQKLAEPPGQTYYYTNAAYLMLGVVIETAAGRPYEDYCRDTVLRPLGIEGARLDPAWGVLSSFGGWRLTGPQYLRFLEAYDDDAKVLGPKARAFMADGDGKWMNDRKDIYYALGIIVRSASGGRNLWHSGAWKYKYDSAVNANLREDFGTYAVSLARGVSWFAYYAPKPGDAQVVELDRAIGRAIAAVTTWPDGDLYPQYGLK